MTAKFEFNVAFKALTGHPPFPWQQRMFVLLSKGVLPLAVDIPTGIGKTAIMAIWLLARAAGAELPRRLVYVVDRRAVVDQATEFAETIRDKLSSYCELEAVRRNLGLDDRMLPISTLRGRHVDNREWMEDPGASAIIVGTVDMIGSRLLFEGYGVSRRMRPFAAGLMGCDTLVLLDEAHLSRPFERLLRQIEEQRRVGMADAAGGLFRDQPINPKLPPPFRVLPLSATLSGDAENTRFELDEEDRKNDVVHQRLEATKALTIEDMGGDAKLEEILAERAWQLALDSFTETGKQPRLLIYCDRRTAAEKIAADLLKRAKKITPTADTILFVGGRRVREREDAARHLYEKGLIGECRAVLDAPVFVVATSAGEVGVDLDADHMVCDLVAWERMVQRLGRVNRRGLGEARILVIDQGLPEENNLGNKTRVLLESLPQTEENAYLAGPAALAGLGKRPDLHEQIKKATTPMPLYPALSRPLVDAWSMTTLAEHTGRPEIGPWLRGWVDDDKSQTQLVWRRHLPLQCTGTSTKVDPPNDREVEAFFEATAVQTSELLEAETSRVVTWLRARAREILKKLNKAAGAQLDEFSGAMDDAPENGVVLSSLSRHAPFAFVLDGDGKPRRALNLEQVVAAKDLQQELAGQRLIVDALFGGLNEGLLDVNCDACSETIENNWGKPEDWEQLGDRKIEETGLPTARVRRLREADRPVERAMDDPWRETFALPCRLDSEGEPQSWLVVEKWRGTSTNEDGRGIARVEQRLAEHHAWIAKEAERIATALDLEEKDRAMLVAVARHHDDGKKALRWQRAFNAPKDGPYAKTKGPLNQRVLNGYRHEFQSTLDAAANGLEGVARDDLRFDLALHLIAAHHGNARPSIGIEGCDSLPPSAAASEAHDIALRFARLQRHWGPWGLAWWEALLRAADQRASRALDETNKTRTLPAAKRGDR